VPECHEFGFLRCSHGEASCCQDPGRINGDYGVDSSAASLVIQDGAPVNKRRSGECKGESVRPCLGVMRLYCFRTGMGWVGGCWRGGVAGLSGEQVVSCIGIVDEQKVERL
jgi:hypothetical protein